VALSDQEELELLRLRKAKALATGGEGAIEGSVPATTGNVRFGDVIAGPKQKPRTFGEPTVPEKQEGPSLFERGVDVVKSAGIGGVAGAFTPEILTGAGLAAGVFPVTAPAAPFLLGAGQAARGARIAGAAGGALGGAVGETSGQAVELAGGGKPAAEAARFVGGMATPELVRAAVSPFAKAGGYGLSVLANKFGLPGTAARSLGQILESQEKGVKGVSLTDQQRKFIQDKIASIRGGQPSVEPLKEVFGILQTATNRFIQSADQDAAYLESQAASVLREAEAQGGAITQQFAKRASNLISQFEKSAQNIRDAANNQADNIIKNANDAAAAVRESAANKAPNIVSQAEQEANRIIQQGQTQADQMMAQARQREERLRSVSARLRQSAGVRTTEAGQQIAKVGQAKTPTELGTSLRDSFESEFQRLRGVREANVQKYKTQAFDDALAKEKSGVRYQETQAYRNSIEQINQELKNPETGLANVPSGEVRDSLTKVKDLLQKGIRTTTTDPQTGEQIIKYQPLGFEALEKMRRSLRDRASGLPAEGYDAIGQQQAGRLAGYVEDIQKEFSPAFSKYLEQYKIDSKPLNDFRSRVGKAMVGKEDFDFSQFKTDPASLGSAAFKTASSVRQLIGVAGQDQSEEFARTFLADRLRNAQSANDVRKVMDDSRDWIGLFPTLQKQLSDVAQSVGTAKTVAEKREALAKGLRTEMRGVLPSATIAAGRVEAGAGKQAAAKLTAAERESGRLLTKAETEAGGIISSAEREAGNLRTEAEARIGASARSVEQERAALESEAKERAAGLTTQAQTKAGELTAAAQTARKEAQQKADLIIGKKYDFEQVRTLLTSGTREQWAAISEIIKADPQGKAKLAQSVSQMIADRAEASLKGAIKDWGDLSVKLTDNGLMSKAEADRIAAKLNEIFVSPVSTKQKSTMAQRLVRNAITGYAAPGVERAREKVME
jgi:cell division septum initiation protein DivIVA